MAPSRLRKAKAKVDSLAQSGQPRRVLIVMTNQTKTAQKATQQQRLRAALRENLKRRKAQAKARAKPDAAADISHDSAGIAPDKESERG